MRHWTEQLHVMLASGCCALCALTFQVPCGAELAQADVEDAGEESAELATARLHFENGVELLQSTPPNYQDAYRQFELAREKLVAARSEKSWKVLGNLGLCALKLERDGEAIAYYSEYLERGGDSVDPREREAIVRELLLLRGNMTKVTIESSDPNARISVQREGSSTPTQLYSLEGEKTELGLRAGSLTITARSDKGTLTWNPVLSAGEEASHRFDFDAEEESAADAPAAPPAATTNAVPEERRGPGGLKIAGYATAGVGLATLGIGGILGLSSRNQAQAAENKCIEKVCETSTEDDFDSAQKAATTANILFVAGGVLTAAGVTLVILGGSKSSEQEPTATRLQLSPLATPSGGGFFAQGTF